jgi:hypothetical protein
MSLRNRFVLAALLFSLAVLAGCGSSNGTSNPVPPPTGTFSNSSLNGTYVFSVSGTDSLGAPYAIVGSFSANGSGGITGGTLDINDANTSIFTSGPIPNSAIASNSSYGVGVDGRGKAALGTSTPFGTITLAFVLENSSHGLVTEFDNTASGSGTLDVQTAGTTPTGSYAFGFSGYSVTAATPLATVGNFALGSGGSLTGLQDFNEGGILAYPNETLTGSLVVGPSSTPTTTLTTPAFNGLIFDVYSIDATHLKFIEMDTFATLSGDAFSQTSGTMPTGPMAFTLQGFYPASTSTPFAAGGFMVTDGGGNITSASTEDYSEGSNISSAPGPFTAAYTAAGTGRYTLDNFATFVGGTSYAAYPSSGGVLLLEIDNTGITMGAAYPQTSGATFAAGEGYGLNLTGIFLGSSVINPAEVDDIAEFTANSTGTTAIGVIDENYAPSGFPTYSLALNGTYAPPDSNGRGQISANAGNSTTSTLNGGFILNFYTVDGTTFPFIELDGGQVASGVFVKQSPTAASSAIAKPRLFVMPPLIKAHSAREKNK